MSNCCRISYVHETNDMGIPHREVSVRQILVEELEPGLDLLEGLGAANKAVVTFFDGITLTYEIAGQSFDVQVDGLPYETCRFESVNQYLSLDTFFVVAEFPEDEDDIPDDDGRYDAWS